MLDGDEFTRWRSEADRALQSAQVQAAAGLHNWACFAAEQAAQLAVKALLHGLGKGRGDTTSSGCGSLMPETWAEEALSERRHAREALIEKARSFVAELARAGDLVAAVVYGSVARGDFNVWSDIDLLLIRSRLPAKAPDRLAALADRAPAGVQALAWTPEEFTKAHRAGNPIAVEALARGVVLHGAEALKGLAQPGR